MSLSLAIPHLRRWAFAAAGGIMAGTAATLFLYLLNLATDLRAGHPSLVFGLPLAGLAIAVAYHRYGRNAAGGNNLVFEEIHDPNRTLPARMAPMILLSTVVTHLFGGSAGREGTVVQMGASLADQISRFFKVTSDERRALLVAGAGAGFGAAVAAPWAGVIFGMEVIQVGKLRLFAWTESLIASFVAYGMTVLLHAPHTHYPIPEIPMISASALFGAAAAGVVFGLCALIFSRLVHAYEKALALAVRAPLWRPVAGGIAVLFLFLAMGTDRYLGLGIPVIRQALENVTPWTDPLWKTLFTVLTVGSGFKGGEFVPLVFIGSTVGQVLADWLPITATFAASLGFAAVFAGASNTPIACTLMAMEIFGARIAPYAALACALSFLCSGRRGIYSSQKFIRKGIPWPNSSNR